MKDITIQKMLMSTLGLSMLFLVVACESLLDVELDPAMITKDRMFSDDAVADAAVTGIYSDMFDALSFASGSNSSVTAWGGLLADEFKSYSAEPTINEFAQNRVSPDNLAVLNLWSSMYKTIYQANAVIEGVSGATALTTATKDQLEGEARFVRAFSYFYLINFFGEVPLNVTTDYRVNSVTSKNTVAAVQAQIAEDLDIAEAKLSPDYVTGDRARPNLTTVLAFRARIALYAKNWAAAEAFASQVIQDERYRLVPLDDIFKMNSQEAIWQLQPVEVFTTNEASAFIMFMNPTYGPSYNGLPEDFLAAFEDGDTRRDHWVGTYSEDVTWYYPFKYKVQNAAVVEEGSVVFRLAEQYLIRAEARLLEGDLEGALADVDSIRSRAGLPLVSTGGTVVTADSLSSLIQHERRIELFAEWGHRWLDLKRHDALDTVIGSMKPDWNEGDELLPLPQVERNRNPQLGSQNPGYF